MTVPIPAPRTMAMRNSSTVNARQAGLCCRLVEDIVLNSISGHVSVQGAGAQDAAGGPIEVDGDDPHVVRVVPIRPREGGDANGAGVGDARARVVRRAIIGIGC